MELVQVSAQYLGEEVDFIIRHHMDDLEDYQGDDKAAVNNHSKRVIEECNKWIKKYILML